MTDVIGFAGFSDSGKTTLISRLVKQLASQGLKAAVIKHDAHGHYKEVEGTDSSMYREAGAAATVVISPGAYAEYRREPVDLEQVVDRFRASRYDFIFVEGFKKERHDKIALFRNVEQADILEILTAPPIAVAAPQHLAKLAPAGIPYFDPEDASGIAEWLINRQLKNTV